MSDRDDTHEDAIDGAADAEITVLHQRVNIAAPTYKPYGPVLTDALTATLRQLFGSAGVKPAYVGERVTGPWALPQSWVPWVEAEVLLGTREGESVRGGALGDLPNKVANKSEADALIDEDEARQKALWAKAEEAGIKVEGDQRPEETYYQIIGKRGAKTLDAGYSQLHAGESVPTDAVRAIERKANQIEVS